MSQSEAHPPSPGEPIPLVFNPNRERFQIELEFVQCLANPWYLNHLGQLQYFKEPEFVAYLKYLLYWKQPKYAKYIIYPHALYFLDLLQHPEFREAIAKQDVATYIHQKQYFHWLFYRRGKPLPDNLEELVTKTENGPVAN
ncbi:suppressor of hpr1 [Tieghemiomyces parasiticus]|uniref:Mediator of RNA polymerase II transcription subunit 31 n=1 Tax=Tieghemiomyces parasiticus TaxID=78921 RepID=A0A9W8A9Z2_9FUNG|nr:suppressor of hpr1 [Tieghemiomyces parasiticus]